ncbi:hypothetical protein FHS61_003158 [Altererythrobacter atlanticus]|uniref:Uncharacterized protein n=1 Tax=Croceibacterium atlanticum TaxID=1267766 RepID=A0A0F7KTN8_9SPHN|nr:hypothetical protein [Croceibacterium atlanticum]AKH42934.1 hypothetical protein WYH_01899 [Croceibacterium atlanticum]MBB5734109.1 hypothetical protein [Croceibacterium atlanticum]
MSITRAGCMLAALLAAMPANAQSAEEPEPGGGDIVVTGQAEMQDRGTISRQARAITRKQNWHDRPLARFEDRLCPGILGLKPDYAALMIDRIRANAERLKMWMADDTGCEPNLVIAFVEDGKAAMADYERKYGYRFRLLPLEDRRDLLGADGPVRVWTMTQTRTRDGMPIYESGSLIDPPVSRQAMAHSKIYLSTREDILQVVILFDLAAVQGKSLVQLADYATMRGLARTVPPEGEQAMDTILGLFSVPSGRAPAEMTEFDRAYLASLYDSIPNLPATARILGVNRQLRLARVAEEDEGGR